MPTHFGKSPLDWGLGFYFLFLIWLWVGKSFALSGSLWVKVEFLEVLAFSWGSVVSPFGSVLADLGMEAGVAAFGWCSEASLGGPQS